MSNHALEFIAAAAVCVAIGFALACAKEAWTARTFYHRSLVGKLTEYHCSLVYNRHTAAKCWQVFDEMGELLASGDRWEKVAEEGLGDLNCVREIRRAEA